MFSVYIDLVMHLLAVYIDFCYAVVIKLVHNKICVNLEPQNLQRPNLGEQKTIKNTNRQNMTVHTGQTIKLVSKSFEVIVNIP